MNETFGQRSIGRVIDDAIAMYRAHFKTYVVAALWIVFPAVLVQLAVSTAFNATYFDTIMSTPAGTDEEAMAALGALALVYVGLFVSIIIVALARSYYTCSVLNSAEPMLFGQARTPKEFVKAGKKRWFAYLVANIAVGFIVYSIYGMSGTIGALLICLLPFLLLLGIAVTLWVAATFSMVGTAVVVERATIGAAFSRSMKLVRGKEWRTIGFLVMMLLITSVMQQAVSSLSVIPYVVESLRNPDAFWAMTSYGAPGSLPLTIVTGLLSAVALSVTVPLSGIATYSYYLDLRARSDGVDLVMRARALRGAA